MVKYVFLCYIKNMPKIVTEKMAHFSLRQPQRLKDRLSDLASREHRSLGAQINWILERYLDELDKEKSSFFKTE